MGWRVKVTESMGDTAAPAVGTSVLFALGCLVGVVMDVATVVLGLRDSTELHM